MAGFEDLIRGTLLKHGDKTPASRAAIYHSSRQALERMLSQNQNLDLAAQSLQRQRLESAISNIEAGYAAAAAAAAADAAGAAAAAAEQVGGTHVPLESPPSAAQSGQQVPASSVDTPSPAQAQPSQTGSPSPLPPPPIPIYPPQQPGVVPEASVAPTGPDTIRVDPGLSVPPVPRPPSAPVAPPVAAGSVSMDPLQSPPLQSAAAPPPLAAERPQQSDGQSQMPESPDAYSEAYAAATTRERKPYAKLLLWTIILVGIGVAGWWAFNFGPAFLQQQLGGSVPNPGQTIESGEFVPGAEEGWVSAFNPSDDSINIETGGRGTAEVFQNPNESFVRLASNAGGNDNNLKILIPRGVMLPLKGEAATIEIKLKSAAKTKHEFAVYCEFGAMGSCGRKRLPSPDRAEAQIFDVILDNISLNADEDAYLSFNTDLAGEGRAIDIYSIRVRLNR